VRWRECGEGRREARRKSSERTEHAPEARVERETDSWEERDEKDYSRLVREARRKALGEDWEEKRTSERETKERGLRLWEKWTEEDYNRLIEKARRKAMEENWDEKEPVSKYETSERKSHLREERDEEKYDRIAWETRRRVLGEGRDDPSPLEGKVSEKEPRFWKGWSEEDYNRLVREAYRKITGKELDQESISEHETSDRKLRFGEEWDEAPYNRIAERAWRKVMGECCGDTSPPDRGVAERGEEASERIEAYEAIRDLEETDKNILRMRRHLYREEIRRSPKERLYQLAQYHRFLDRREELLEELKPEELSDFKEKRGYDAFKLDLIRKCFERNKVTDLAQRDPEGCERVLDRYEKLLNKRHHVLARIEPRTHQPEKAQPPEDSEYGYALHVDRQEWIQQEDHEKTTVRSTAVRGERSKGARFEQSGQTVCSETSLGSMESSLERTTVRVEKKEDVDEDSVLRIWAELTRIEEAFKTRPKDEEIAIKQYIIAVNPILEILEKQEEGDEHKRVITVVDRGEHKWLKKVDYVLKTEKRWVDEEGSEHHVLCVQAVGYERSEKAEAEADKPWGRAVKEELKYGTELEQKMRVETDLIEFNPEVTIEGGRDEKREDESKTVINGGSSGEGFEAGGEETGQQTVLTFYRGEKSEEPENAHVEHVIYKVVHEPPSEETTSTSVFETVQEANAPAEVVGLGETSDSVDDSLKDGDSVETVDENTPPVSAGGGRC
jgi:hypothetical protein